VPYRREPLSMTSTSNGTNAAVLRSAQPRDVPAIVALIRELAEFEKLAHLGKPGLYLEDLYVQPAHRGAGVGRALLAHLAGLANQRDYGRFEWSVLDWNVNAIRFYERMGATLLPEWRICRVSGEALRDFGH
jgi:GNAT superfamily N-acetyltransferase